MSGIAIARDGTARAERVGLLYDWAVVLALVALILCAGYVRGALLWPQPVGMNESPYDDEGVYAEAAQLMAQGKQPYRDFFYAHPPLGPAMFMPAIEYHFNPWGSPTSFMMLRYLATAYGAVTVGFVFLLAWRLWGLAGGIFSGLLLAVDPTAVSVAGRHVMLEAPLFWLMALAVLFYVFARAQEHPSVFPLLCAGFLAAAAGAVKVQGLLVLAAFLLDLLARRRWSQLAAVFGGAVVLWLPLWGYLIYLRDGNPLGQFLWFQVLRPPDGIAGIGARLRQLAASAWLMLLAGALAVPALVLLFARPAAPRRRPERAPRAPLTSPGGVQLRRLPGVSEPAAPAEATPPPAPEPVTPPPVPAARAEDAAPGPNPAWSLLPWWIGLVLVTLLLSRTYYAHYAAHLTLPLAILAGALPAGIIHAFRFGWGGRLVSVVLVAAGVALLAPAAYRVVADDFSPHPDRVYEIVARYVNDAIGPDQGVFVLDAQFSFRAARRPAREADDRFIVDGYGMLLYHGLGIDGTPMLELARRALTKPVPGDPYQVMWRQPAQDQIEASIERSDLVVIDAMSDGRLTAATHRWLDAHGRLVEKQERYAIYRIAR
ncbi:MAG TPA: hypothetical protein VFW96_20325 [Thermomicrobiales bacterium]|nr:hypothetical protein [Thermomicrobiales bacterium]